LNDETGSFGTLIQTTTATVRFEIDSSLTTPGEPSEYWKATSGTIQWRVTATGGQCTGNFQGTIPIDRLGDDGNPMAMLNLWEGDAVVPLRPKQLYTVGVGPWPEQYIPHFNYTCKDSPPMTASIGPIAQWWLTDPTGENPVSADGKSLSGTYQMPGLGPTATMKWSWTLHLAP
jgi:hypothetical protein